MMTGEAEAIVLQSAHGLLAPLGAWRLMARLSCISTLEISRSLARELAIERDTYQPSSWEGR